jgi:peptidoglycan/LPS O-acetylase OafA/YrhL
MQIRQIQVANDSVQDRLVLRIATQANEEIRVFFTRRFLRELWPHLIAMLLDHLTTAPAFSPETPQAETASESDAGPTFEKPFSNDDPTFPLGSQPLLASEATLEAAGPGLARLILREARERSFNLNLNAELLQALCSMLRASSDQAGWELGLDYGKPTAAQASSGKKLLH